MGALALRCDRDFEKMKDIKEMNLLETMRDYPNRVITLAWKLISVKGVALALCSLFIWRGTITGWEAVTLFVLTVLMVIGGREAEKWKRYFGDLRGGKN